MSLKMTHTNIKITVFPIMAICFVIGLSNHDAFATAPTDPSAATPPAADPPAADPPAADPPAADPPAADPLVVTFTSPTDDSIINTSTPLITGIGTSSPNKITKIQVDIHDGKGFKRVTHTGTKHHQTSGTNHHQPWSFQVTSPLAEGFHTFTAQITNELGFTTETTIGFTFTVLASPPSISHGNYPSIQPPSFGGGEDTHFSNGLTINNAGLTQSNVIDISQYNTNVDKQLFFADKPVSLKLKVYQNYGVTVPHMELFMIPTSFANEDMSTANAMSSIEYNDGKNTIITDPNNVIKDASVSKTTSGDGNSYFTFTITPTKSFPHLNFLARTWNDQLFSTDVKFYDAGPIKVAPEVYPEGVVKYADWNTLYGQITADGYDKAKIMNHIHNSNNVFLQGQLNGVDSGQYNGQTDWLYDTNSHQVTLEIKSSDGVNVIRMTESLQKMGSAIQNACQTEQFKPYCSSDNGFYGFNADNKKLTKDQVEQMFRMGMWEGALPSWLSYDQLNKDLADYNKVKMW